MESAALRVAMEASVVQREVRMAGPITAVLLLALLLGLESMGPSPASAQAPTDFAPGEILVRFKPGTPAQVIAEIHRQNGGQVLRVIPGIEVHVVRVRVG